MMQVDQNQWIGSIKASELMALSDKQLLYYNERTQRPLQHVEHGEVQYWRPYVNRSALASIEKSFREGTYIPNTITLNIPDAIPDYDEDTMTLSIEGIDHFDILDGDYMKCECTKRPLDIVMSHILKIMIDGSLNSQEYLSKMYKEGVTARYAMQYTGDLDKERREKLKTKFADQLTGIQNAGKVIPVPKSLTLTPLTAGSLADNQYLDLKKYSALQIAAAFGIKPNQLNDYSKSSYANSEMQQLSYLVDTVMYRLKAYEEEINSICLTEKERNEGYLYKFNEKALLRTDSKTQIEFMASAVNNGIYKPNEARGFLDLPAAEGGDQLIVNGNYIPLTRVGDQYAKSGKEE